MHSLVMTVIGEDRPGLVDALAAAISRQGGNWLESRMMHVAGQFAGILELEIAEDKHPAFLAELDALKGDGLQWVLAQGSAKAAEAAEQPLLHLDLLGQDRPGIVAQISQTLVQFGINVENLHTECASAPMSGEKLFKARAVLRVKPDMEVDALRQKLEKIAADLMVDIRLEEAS